MLAERLNELGDEPIFVSDFDSELVIFRQLFEEWPEPSEEIIHAEKCLLGEISELKKKWPEFLAERVHYVQKLSHFLGTVCEHLLVSNSLRYLRCEDEVLRCLGIPALDSRERRRLVE